MQKCLVKITPQESYYIANRKRETYFRIIPQKIQRVFVFNKLHISKTKL